MFSKSSIIVLLGAASFLQTALSIPVACPKPGDRPAKDDTSELTMTPNGGAELPPPSDGLTLKFVTVGRGTQNYTCADSTEASIPKAVGAIATLHDGKAVAKRSRKAFDNLPGLSLYANGVILLPLPTIGKHYFDASGTPVFDLGAKGVFKGKKLANVPAPAKAHKGLKGEGAVDWLQLGDTGASTGITQTYRVVTAGGKAPATCQGQPKDIQVQYATQYWFYG
ncbi:MAG: hypothetical protein M1825_006210 [Sarcosagium campestre]|nr:MAG: hypothetical protein M1825_006210 [Sarcosagium campestre]